MNATPSDGVYVDTSVLGAYYCREQLSEKAEAALRKISGPVISNVSEVEFCSLISRKHQLKELSDRQSDEVLALFDSHLAQGFYRRLFLSNEHYLKARQLVLNSTSGLRTLDALHLAVALTGSFTMLTADKLLARAAKQIESRFILLK